MYSDDIIIAQQITRRIVSIAPGVITPESFASIVARLADTSYLIWDPKGDSDPRIAAAHRESGIINTAAEIAFGPVETSSGTLLGASSQTIFPVFDIIEAVRYFAAVVASFSPDLVNDCTVEALVGEVLTTAYYFQTLANSHVLNGVCNSVQAFNTAGSAFTVEDLLADSRKRADTVISDFDKWVARRATKISYTLTRQYAESPQTTYQMLEKRAQTWQAPKYSDIRSTAQATAPPAYSEATKA